MRIVPGLRDRDEARAQHMIRKGAAVCRRNDAVILTPDEQGLCPHPRQPMLELGIVHVGLPAEAGEALVVARNDRELILRHRLVVALALLRIEPFAPGYLMRRQHPDVGDIALGWATKLGAVGSDQR